MVNVILTDDEHKLLVTTIESHIKTLGVLGNIGLDFTDRTALNNILKALADLNMKLEMSMTLSDKKGD